MLFRSPQRNLRAARLTGRRSAGIMAAMNLLLFVMACSGDAKESGEDSVVTTDSATTDGCSTVEGKTGTLALSFRMEWDYLASMDEAPIGHFLGSIYACKDSSAIGPADGVTALLDVDVALDLSQSNGDPTAVLFTTTALPAE